VSFVDAPNGGAYYDYTLTEDGTLVTFGHDDADYSTDVLAGQADSFIRAAPQTQPLFLYFSVFAPHQPSTPATKYKDQFRSLPPYRPPNYNEADVSDKPEWVRDLPLITEQKQKGIDNSRKNQYRTLLSADDAVATIVTALTETQRLDNTMIVFASDNGWSLGEHRWNNKKAMWEESIRVPEIVRYDPLIPTPRTDAHLVANIDLAPTFASAAGVAAPGVEGMDMMPLLADPQAAWRHDLLVEHLHEARGSPPMDGTGPYVNSIPTFCAVRDDSLQPEGYAYVVYDTGEEELYDLKTDAYELTNAASDDAYLDVKLAMRDIAKQLCDPVPPGFDWPYALAPPPAPGTRR
jgi:arylsulfatase A-like enzyme